MGVSAGSCGGSRFPITSKNRDRLRQGLADMNMEAIEMAIGRKEAEPFLGKHVYVMTRQGEMIDGILCKLDRDRIYLRPKGKTAAINAFSPFFNPFTPLVLFDLLAISTLPFGFGFGSPFFF